MRAWAKFRQSHAGCILRLGRRADPSLCAARSASDPKHPLWRARRGRTLQSMPPPELGHREAGQSTRSVLVVSGRQWRREDGRQQVASWGCRTAPRRSSPRDVLRDPRIQYGHGPALQQVRPLAPIATAHNWPSSDPKPTSLRANNAASASPYDENSPTKALSADLLTRKNVGKYGSSSMCTLKMRRTVISLLRLWSVIPMAAQKSDSCSSFALAIRHAGVGFRRVESGFFRMAALSSRMNSGPGLTRWLGRQLEQAQVRNGA
ncbi:hypothetical protein AWB81_07123 [Caballeronia arationis]|nr:hypothetical protein AWB81_07123 [Caballeronia arationis]